MKKILLSIITGLIFPFFLAANPLVEDISAVPLSSTLTEISSKTDYKTMTEIKGNEILISWKIPANNSDITSLRIYRSTKPITRYSQIEKTNYIAQVNPNTVSYIDRLKDYNDYFYAVIAVTDRPYDFILYSVNSTSYGVHLEKPADLNKKNKKDEKEKIYAAGTMRETPLPYLNYIEGIDGESLISTEISDKAVTLVNSSTTNVSDKKILPYFFEEDLISPDNGDDYILFDILKNTFVQEKYSDALVQLKRLTGRNISQNIINRAYFYMGQAYFFSNDYENAVKEFVKVEQVYPVLAKKWINLSLDRF